jgi:signal peptidase I
MRRVLALLVAFFLVFSFFSAFLIETYRMDSASMAPALSPGDRMLLVPLLYGPRLRFFGLTIPGFASPQRGDVVAVRPGYVGPRTVWQRIADPFVRFFSLQRRHAGDSGDWQSAVQIKRIVGLPGDTIRIERFVAYVKPEGGTSFSTEFDLASRTYDVVTGERPVGWDAVDPFGEAAPDIVLGDDEYFVLSDDRLSGIDSRHWGPVSFEDIDGRIVHRFWPFSSWGGL